MYRFTPCRLPFHPPPIPPSRSPSQRLFLLPLSLSTIRHQSTSFTTSSKPNAKFPLTGITVISLEQAIAAPFATRQLAELGARVIKIERPGHGDFARSYDTRVHGTQASHFIWANRSKESLALDLKHPPDLAIVKKLLARADVLVQNLAPGATARLGLSYGALKDEYPGLIVCDISGYGVKGENTPYREKKAYDLLVQSEAGLLSITGTPEQPAKVGISIADISAAMYALTNILAALMTRQQNAPQARKGSHIDISMLESMAEWMSFPLYYTLGGQPAPPRVGAAHATIYPYGPFPTGKDNGSVMLGLQNEREWAKLCAEVLDKPELAADARFATNSLRVQNRGVLRSVMEDVFGQTTAPELVRKLDGAGIANAVVRKMRDVWEHPQLKARDRWTEVDTPGGKVPALLPPGVEGREGVRMERVPAVGEHNGRILAELGLLE